MNEYLPVILGTIATAAIGTATTGVTLLVKKVVSHDKQLSLMDARLERFDAGIASRHVENRQDMQAVKTQLDSLTRHLLNRRGTRRAGSVPLLPLQTAPSNDTPE